LQTKLYVPPIRPALVSRPRLVQRLDAGLDRGCRLTLVSAPAGYGKTTLLSAWTAHREPPTPVAWLSLDGEDNEPRRFWAYVVAAIRTVRPSIEESLQAALASTDPPPVEAVLTRLLNQVAQTPEPLALILDDYHVISAPAVHQALGFLLENMPSQMHLILATRADPPLPLARLRGRGHLSELHAADLRFAADEAAAFLNEVMGLALSAAQVATLERRTEGWIVGLQMAALSMQGRHDVAAFIEAFGGSHRFVLDYLVEEVLNQQPAAVRDFLLQTAILSRMTAPLCDAVTGRSDSQRLLASLEAANLFLVPLDDERRWYRYHHLFGDLLRQRLTQTRREEVPALHRLASLWYEQGELFGEAIQHALAAEDFARVARLIQQAGWTTLTRGEMRTVLDWLDALPAQVLEGRPELAVLNAWAMAKSGRMDQAEACLQEIPPDQASGQVAAVRAYIAGARGDLSLAVALARRALAALPEEDLVTRAIVTQNLGVAYHWSGDSVAASQTLTQALALSRAANQRFQALTAMAILGRAYEMQGALDQALAVYDDALALASEVGDHPVPFAGMAYVGLAGVLYERNDLESALRCAREGLRLSELGGFVAYQVFGHARLAQVYAARGQRDRSLEHLQKAKQLGQRHDYALVMTVVTELRVRLWLAQGDLARAARWAEAHQARPDAKLDPAREIEQIAVARVWVAQGKASEALALLSWLREAAQAGNRTGTVIHILVAQALAHQAQADGDAALDRLGQALSLAEAQGYVRTFVDEGAPMARLLRRALSENLAPGTVATLLAALDQEPAPTAPAAQGLIEPLTERELEVLRLIVAGLSNPQIAEELFIATSTVKSHVNHIYGKLGVERRTQAVAKAQELDLL
jgi:LuxR family maltose regulon positive regulatory protein